MKAAARFLRRSAQQKTAEVRENLGGVIVSKTSSELGSSGAFGSARTADREATAVLLANRGVGIAEVQEIGELAAGRGGAVGGSTAVGVRLIDGADRTANVSQFGDHSVTNRGQARD